MASADIGLSFHGNPNPLYIRDSENDNNSGSPINKFYSSRPELNQSEESLRSPNGQSNPPTGLTYTKINDGRGGEFRIFKSPLKPVKKESNEDLKLFAKLKVKQQI